MKPAELAAYEAVCAADPECRCPLVYREKNAWVHDYTPHFATGVPEVIAAAAITDHLHTRLEQWRSQCGKDTVLRVTHDTDPPNPWCVLYAMGDYEMDDFTCKLSAYLAAHIVRLSLPRELITEMEEA